MQRIIISFFCFVCGYTLSQSQTELNLKAEQDYLEADKNLNQVYQAILIEYSDNEAFIENLKTAQRFWIQFRDAEILMKYPKDDPIRECSAFNQCYYICLSELTSTRVKTLKIWVEGAEEGEVCSGSQKI